LIAEPAIGDAPLPIHNRAVIGIETRLLHTLELEQIPGTRQKLADAAAARGLKKRTLSTIADRNGRSIFEIFTLN